MPDAPAPAPAPPAPPPRKRRLWARVGLGFLVAFLVGIPAGYAFLEWTVQPGFCVTCHLMIPYYKSWESSSHGKHKVACIECHYEPGVVETARGKVMAINMVVKYFTGAEGTKPWAEVSDASCMRSGCHSTRLLAGEVKFRIKDVEIPFNHTPHLLEMRGEKKLRCTSCHSQIVQGEHLTVTTTTCFLCHFKGGKEDPKLSDCNTCHGPPSKPIDLGGFTYEHRAYLERGVRCSSCHPGTTQGAGDVPKHRCNSCHGVAEHLERYGEKEFIHRKHVTDHKVECLQCHTEITHRLRPRPGTPEAAAATAPAPASAGHGAADCESCHSSTHGATEAFFRGEGGRGVAATPSAMWLARVDCSGCHVRLPGALPPARGIVQAKEVACLACHGPEFEGMMGRWQAAFGAASGAVEKEVAAAREAAAAAGGQETLLQSLEDAAHDAALVRGDGSRGVHNPWFARRLLESAHGKAAEAWHTLDPARPPAPSPLGPSFPTKMTCAVLCHLGIEERAIGFAGTRFDHSKHLGKAGDCSACHSTGEQGRPGADHGRTLLGPGDCGKCHHEAKGPGPVAERTCVSCHREEDRFLRGVGEDGTEGPQMMGEVACESCHDDPPSRPVLAAVKVHCAECHEDKPETAAAVDDWVKDAREWRAEAEARLAKVRGTASPEAIAKAEAILLRLKFAVPVHNILRFEEEKEAFDEALK